MNELRQAGRIVRYHTHPTIQPQTVAAHSHGVAMIVWRIYGDKVSSNLLMAALTHDLAEKAIGDVPAPVKWNNPGLMTEFRRLEDQYNKLNHIDFALTEEESLILKIADTLELLEYCYDEFSMGNKGIQEIIDRGKEHLRSKLVPRLDTEVPVQYKALSVINQTMDEFRVSHPELVFSCVD